MAWDAALTVLVGMAFIFALGTGLGYAIKDARSCRPCHCPPCDEQPR